MTTKSTAKQSGRMAAATEPLRYTYMDSPVGRLLLVANEDGLDSVYFERHNRPVEPQPDWIEDAKPLREVQRQLKDYFAGKRTTFDLPLAARGTPFQKKVWRQLSRIPFGKTLSYGELAARVGNPAASRAVGAANGKNPISIIVPCHRVIGADGSLTGFGGGLPVKRQLLEHEGVLEPDLFGGGRARG